MQCIYLGALLLHHTILELESEESRVYKMVSQHCSVRPGCLAVEVAVFLYVLIPLLGISCATLVTVPLKNVNNNYAIDVCITMKC